MNNNRKFNFAAGPSVLPEPVLTKVQNEMLNYQGIGSSIIEASHRSKAFMKIIEDAGKKMRNLLGLSNDYEVLFLHGGASAAFYQIPMNLLNPGDAIDLIDTGMWTKKAIKEAKFFGKVNIAASSSDKNYCYIPKDAELKFTKGVKYRYLCSNNTIFGTQWKKFPQSPDAPLIGDFSSDILSRKTDMSSFSMIFAGAQKNLGPSGVAVIVIKKELLSLCRTDIPSMCSYKIHAENGSMYNTPCTFGIYVINYVLDWITDEGGIEAIDKRNTIKAKMLYDTLDSHSMYQPTADTCDRSSMNVTFTLPSEETTSEFLKKAEEKGFINLKGHRSVGGIRASIYNAFPVEGIEKFCKFLKEFAESR